MRKTMRLIMPGLFLIVLNLCNIVVRGEEVNTYPRSGQCGDNVVWELTQDGTLTVSGSGDMYDYDYLYSGVQSAANLPEWCKTVSEDGAIRPGTDKIRKIIIEDGVTRIGQCAFYHCDGVESLSIGKDVKSIGKKSFYRLDINSVTIPGNVKSIEEQAFFYTNCTSIALSEGIESIGDRAFAGSGTYSEIMIPASVVSIGFGVFSGSFLDGSSELANISVDEENAVYDSRDNCNAIIETSTNTLIQGCKTTVLPSSVVNIGESAFACIEIEEIDLSNIKEIARDAFNATKLKKIVIPNGITQVSEYAFASCKNLETVEIPLSVKKIEAGGFSQCSNIKEIILPEQLEYIGASAFYNCVKLGNIKLPDSLTYIGSAAFNGCEAMTAVTIPQNVETVEESAFAYCDNIEIIEVLNLKGVTTADQCIFAQCHKITKAVFYGCNFNGNVDAHVYQEANSNEWIWENCDSIENAEMGPYKTIYRTFFSQLNADPEIHMYARTKTEVEMSVPSDHTNDPAETDLTSDPRVLPGKEDVIGNVMPSTPDNTDTLTKTITDQVHITTTQDTDGNKGESSTTDTAVAATTEVPAVTKVTDKPTTFNIKNKKTYKKSKKVTIKDSDGIKTIKLNSKKISVKAGKKSISFKLSKYKKSLKKKGKWNKLVVTDMNGKKTTIQFKVK